VKSGIGSISEEEALISVTSLILDVTHLMVDSDEILISDPKKDHIKALIRRVFLTHNIKIKRYNDKKYIMIKRYYDRDIMMKRQYS
jgi:hypothetical protein